MKKTKNFKKVKADLKPIDFLQIYNALEGACRFYSKIRLSLPTTLGTDRIGNVIVWNPPKRAKELGLRFPYNYPIKKHIPYFKIEHEQATYLKTESNKLPHEDFLIRKDYYAVKKIRHLIQSDIEYKIEFAHDPIVIDKLNQLRSFTTCNLADIEHLSGKAHGFWIFKHMHEDNMIKLPAFYGNHLIAEELLQTKQDVNLIHRVERSSKNQTYDTEKYISYKSFILDKDRKTYQTIIMKKALKNINYLITEPKLLTECIENQNSFREYKNQNN